MEIKKTGIILMTLQRVSDSQKVILNKSDFIFILAQCIDEN